MEKIQSAVQLIIFGVSGDLAALKLIPAVFEMNLKGVLPEKFEVLGFARSQMTNEDLRKIVVESVLRKYPNEDLGAKKFAEKFFYVQGQYDDKESLKKLLLKSIELDKGEKSLKVAYLSVPPMVFEGVIGGLSEARDEIDEGMKLKIVVEKPFGTSGKKAEELFGVLEKSFKQEEIFLLDHYLGKHPIKSLLKLRMENNVMNNLLQGHEIANVQITAFEQSGIGKRVGYFDDVGILKDMIQSHLIQILALIAMDIPIFPNDESLQRERGNIVEALRYSENSEDVIMGQYASYRGEFEQTKMSKTDTFCALKLFIDRRNWFGIPIFVRTGKKMRSFDTKVVIEFKKMPFQSPADEPNRLIIELRPKERIRLQLEGIELSAEFDEDGNISLGDYASLIHEIMVGKKLNFLSFSEIRAAWKIVDQIVENNSKIKPEPEIYEDGSDGPKSYLKLTENSGFKWF